MGFILDQANPCAGADDGDIPSNVSTSIIWNFEMVSYSFSILHGHTFIITPIHTFRRTREGERELVGI